MDVKVRQGSPKMADMGTEPSSMRTVAGKAARIAILALMLSTTTVFAAQPEPKPTAAQAVTAAPAPTPKADPLEQPVLPESGAIRKQVFPIDLTTALRLADATNPQLQLVRERVQQALAQQQAAKSLWLPAIRGGVTYSQHTGPLQDTLGKIISTDRNSLEAGAGAFAFGSGPPMLPGVAFDFQVADALFQPLAARRAVEARQAATAAASNDLLFDVSRAFVELQRTYVDLDVAMEAEANTRKLGELTDAYAKSGQGLLADADRVQAEVELRANDVLRVHEGAYVASARLARPLRLDQGMLLRPIDGQFVPLEFVSPQAPLDEQLAAARNARPELAEIASLIGEAQARRNREKFAPLVPTISVGTSYGGFGGSGGGNPYVFADRSDVQAIAYWQLRNLGMGDHAARRDRESQLRQNAIRKEAILDAIAQEVAEAHAQVVFRSRQIENAQRGVKVAVDSFQRNLERIRGAQGLPIEVLQSIQALAQARREYARVVADYNVAQFALQRATGSLLHYEGALADRMPVRDQNKPSPPYSTQAVGTASASPPALEPRRQP